MEEILKIENEIIFQNKKLNPLIYFSKESKGESIHLKNEELNPILNSNINIIGTLNNQFYLIEKIGEGSTGTVYLSYSINSRKEKDLYAIKIINQKDLNNKSINYNEVNFLEKINHKNILKIYEHGIGLLQTSSIISYQVYYIIMDYINHGSLLSQMDENVGFGEDFGRLIFAQLLDGLETIHNSNIVHLDIKLENIMLSGNDYILKYIDFGFATEKSNGYLNTFLGTPSYAAPELHLMHPYLGIYEDIFSLGVTLFIIVTGHLPFIIATPNDPLYQFIFCLDYVNYWRKRNIRVSPSFMELIDNMLAFSPSQRPSISEIRKSKWMQEIKWDLISELKNEFIRREKFLNYKKTMIFNMYKINNNKETNLIKNVDKMLLKIKEEKKIEVINNIKNQLFTNIIQKEEISNNNNSNIINEFKRTKKYFHKKTSLKGFIKVKYNIKSINPLIIIFKNFLKKEGYKITKKDLKNLYIKSVNGKIDIFLSFKKLSKEAKISFNVINGNKEDFLKFTTIIKKCRIK